MLERFFLDDDIHFSNFITFPFFKKQTMPLGSTQAFVERNFSGLTKTVTEIILNYATFILS